MMRAGIKDPLRELPDMHAILDFVEVLWTEHMDAEQLEKFTRDMYREPTIDTASGELVAAPPGFEAEDELASFDAFAKMAGG